MKNIIYIAVSLDGFIAGNDGNLDWLTGIPNPDNKDYGFAEFLDSIDGIVMGRNTFETVMSFGEWPYTKKVFVLSNTLNEIPEKIGSRAEIVTGLIPDILEDLNRRGFRNLYVDGGKTIQSFLELDLIDEMIITLVSILLGDGIPLFGTLARLLKFKAIKAEKLNDSLVQIRYIKLL